MNKTVFSCLCLLWLAMSAPAHAGDKNELPAQVAAVLRTATVVQIYSLEPVPMPNRPSSGERWYGYEVLGKTMLDADSSKLAIEAFEKAVANWDGMIAGCFDPRHALRIEAEGHTWDFLLCYDCHQLEVFRDGKHLDGVGAAGSPEALNELMLAKGLVLSKTGYQPPTPEEIAKREAEEARWLAGMPTSVLSVWEASERFHFGAGPSASESAAMRAALEKQFPDRAERIRRLLGWFGSGAGPWTGVPGWESVPEQLLLEYSTLEILGAASPFSKLSGEQREGAARLFAGWDFGRTRPGDEKLLSQPMRLALFDHVLTTGDPKDKDRHQRARHAFAD
ncbi:hypothetical protein [Arenimonas sp.]|uniref:hypothetical protein n=1 Tax=Arenimonas sp. TaxID=1872635 RepID=UPI0039E68152